MYRVSEIKMPLNYTQVQLQKAAAEKLKVPPDAILEMKLSKKSVDARNKSRICFILAVDVGLKPGTPCGKEPYQKEPYTFLQFPKSRDGLRPVIVGAGPAGLFAALTLAYAGMEPIVLERGRCIEERVQDVELFESTGRLQTESNIQFGEGGAGTFSDGKLTTGIKDKRIEAVLQTFCECGAPEEILYEAKPHIGTDLLRNVIVNLRKKILSLGGEFRFGTCFDGFTAENGKLQSIYVRSGEIRETLDTNILLLAIGHSARDTFALLQDQQLYMVQKPFSVGVRIEHKQRFINQAQYGDAYANPALGAADYKLAVKTRQGRGVYTFCMCPGGSVVAAASEPDRLCINGMSQHLRNGENANSAVLVSIYPEDFKTQDPLEGIAFQRKIEQNAYRYGGGGYRAPVQLASDFLQNRKSEGLGTVEPSYPLGYQLTNLSNIFPGFLQDALREGLLLLNRNIQGFSGEDAVLTGAETRSSSPVRILRDQNMESNIKGIYPCGEGAGYAGGIMSSAVDGIKTAEVLIGARKQVAGSL